MKNRDGNEEVETMTERTMLTFDKGNTRFSNRVVGVLIEDGHVLLHRGINDDYWALPGGRGEMLERSENTVRREFQEELGVEVQVDRLLWVVENFFNFEEIEIVFHELAFYYLISLAGATPLQDKHLVHHCIEEGSDLIYQWFPLEEVGQLNLYPVFLREGLQNLPTTIQHLVNDET
ncbi:MAG: NUDIX hydrolase [Tumebacillaceae bacterium]